jgi:signal transduction histidine kinase
VAIVSARPDRLPARLSALHTARPWLLDVAIVAAIGAIGVVVGFVAVVPDAPFRGASATFGIVLALPLLVRRRYPSLVFAAISMIAIVQWAADVRTFGDAALFVALFGFAGTQPLRHTLIAAGVLEAGVAMAVARWSQGNWLLLFVGFSGLVTAAVALGINQRHRRALVASLHDRAARLERERDQQSRLAAGNERARIAREMHDIVAHNLSVMIALADGATFAIRDAPERAELAMRKSSSVGRHALTEMRRLLGVLREDGPPSTLAPQPGISEIEGVVEQVRAAGLPVHYDVDGRASDSVPDGVQLAAFRIVQEALTNTLKHAGAGTETRVRLEIADGALLVEVADAGPPTAIPAREGGGLRGMRERAAVYDGTIQAGPRRDGGWQVRTRLAYAPERETA